MKRIITCTDGSAYASSLYDLTAWAAGRTGAAVHVLHMLDHHRERADITDLSGNLGLDTGDELLTDLVAFEETKSRLARERGSAILAEAARRLAEDGVGEVTTEQQHGPLVEAVTEMEETADLVVMGKRGESADFATLHLGSNLERVIRASIRPVLVASRKFTPIGSFLIAYDGGPSAEKAVEFAAANPLLRGLCCLLLHAGREDAGGGGRLRGAAARLEAAGHEVTARTVEGDPEEVISRAVAEEAADLLVMGAYGHSRLRQLIVGSTTTAMVRTCQVPVLMFR